MPKPTSQSNLKKTAIWFAIFIGTSILVASILRALTPTQPIIPASSTITTSQREGVETSFEQIAFTGEQPLLQEEYPVFTIELSTNESEVVNKLVSTYQLNDRFEDTLWLGNTHTLSLDKTTNQLTFSNNNQQYTDQLISDINSAINSAQIFIDDIYPNSMLVTFSQDVQFFKGNYHLELTNQTEAQYLRVPFSYALADLPVFVEQQQDWYTSVLVGADNSVVKTILSLEQFKFTQSLLTKPITVNQAIENVVDSGLGTFIAVYQDEPTPFDISTINNSVINQAILEYRVDKETMLAYPVYRLVGEFKNFQGESLEGQIITPAIKTEMYQP